LNGATAVSVPTSCRRKGVPSGLFNRGEPAREHASPRWIWQATGSGPAGFFEMPQTGIQNLSYPAHLRSQCLLSRFDSLIRVTKALIHSPLKIGQALVIDQKAHED